jgi:tetratricopeptide (TPR) repeat protein
MTSRRSSWLHGSLILLGLTCALGAREPTWIRLELPDFTVVSATSESATRNWAIEFEQFHRGMKQVLKLNDRLLHPVTVVLFRSQRDLDPYKPLEKGKPAKMDGYFARSSLANYIGVALNGESDQTQRLIFHEGVHWLTNVADDPLPLWLNEGLAEVFSTFQVRSNVYSYGDPLPWHVLVLRHSKYIPLKELLYIPRESLLYNEGDRTSIFYAESWAFVHYLLFSGHHELLPKYNELVHRLDQSQDPDATFRQVFGCDCAEMQKRLQAYMNSGVYSKLSLPFDRSSIEAQAKVRQATPAEVELAKASLLLGVGRPEAALPILTRCAAELPGNLEAEEAVGMADYEIQRYDDAEQWFHQAAEQHSPHAFVYSFLGDEAVGSRPGRFVPIMNMSSGSLREATDYYLRDLALNPRDEHAYQNIATALYGLDSIQPAEIQMLRLGAVLFPTDGNIKLGLAVVELKQGSRAKGLALLQALAERTGPGTAAMAQTARNLFNQEQQRELMDRANRFAAERKFPETLATIDQLWKVLDPVNRPSWQEFRDRVEIAAEIQQAADLANSGELDKAAAVVDAAVASGKAKGPAQRQLLQMRERLAVAQARRQ